MAGIGLVGAGRAVRCRDAEDFADKVSSVLKDQGLRRELRSGAASVRQRLSWDSRLRRMEQLIVQAVAKRVKPSRELVTEH